ncbi:drug/metabolite transporter (DMT)-like permease [Streptosporangium becharense]|uniref:Drug/metabolite transporter (DMT)-like permease n=1 Tax=Streptosporangium becharense TaxID=1816182 RepID=A0A7W9MJA7_9ACTN|nr:drug/metabolite transporter (DMT)-like permease [Streptosporangium becharense]MBB5822314.1 drug/metabolite transporter (DMT)-like permease [Streptosporangium becharense]
MTPVVPRPLLGAVLLLFVGAAWGSAFPLMKDLITRMPVADVLAERYGVAALVLVTLRPGCLRGLARGTWPAGLALGLLFGVGQTAQAMALHDLPAPVSGFAVGSYVVITPVLGLVLFGVAISGRVWAAVLLALAAMAVFVLLREAEDDVVSLSALAVTLLSAVLYAIHTLVFGTSAAARRNAYAVTVIQLGTIAVMTGLLAVPDGLALPGTPSDWAALGHLAVVACALGFLARSYGQVHVPPVPAAVILSAQPLWATGLAVAVHGEPLTASVLLGGGLVALAMLLAVPPGGPFRAGRRGRRRVPSRWRRRPVRPCERGSAPADARSPGWTARPGEK